MGERILCENEYHGTEAKATGRFCTRRGIVLTPRQARSIAKKLCPSGEGCPMCGGYPITGAFYLATNRAIVCTQFSEDRGAEFFLV